MIYPLIYSSKLTILLWVNDNDFFFISGIFILHKPHIKNRIKKLKNEKIKPGRDFEGFLITTDLPALTLHGRHM